MSPKELNYIEDALGHEQFLMNQCQEAIQNLQDPALKNQAQQMEQKHKQIFSCFLHINPHKVPPSSCPLHDSFASTRLITRICRKPNKAIRINSTTELATA